MSVFSFNRRYSKEQRRIARYIRTVFGVRPIQIQHYVTSLRHSSEYPDVRMNNERLEFLGDAILDSVVSEYLYAYYPNKTEGFMTQMRAKIVNRRMLNGIADKLGINEQLDLGNNQRNANMGGNALESVVGALFIDKGYIRTKAVVIKKILTPFIHLEELEVSELNYKSILVEWAQAAGKQIVYKTIREFERDEGGKLFEAGVFVDGDLIATAIDAKKKNAEKLAAASAYEHLNLGS